MVTKFVLAIAGEIRRRRRSRIATVLLLLPKEEIRRMVGMIPLFASGKGLSILSDGALVGFQGTCRSFS